MSKKNGCDEKQLVLFHYDELNKEQRQQLQAHLETCSSCRTGLEQLQASLAAIPPYNLQLNQDQKNDFTARVVAGTQRRSRSTLPTWGGALTAACALTLAVIFFNPAPPADPVMLNGPTLADLEILEQFELLEDLELLQDLELLEELEDLG